MTTGLKKIIGTKTETSYYRGRVRNVVTSKYTSRTNYAGGFEFSELVAVLECGHTMSFRLVGKRKRCRCHKCEYPSHIFNSEMEKLTPTDADDTV